ncbi:hypothetical protein MP638_000988 [Amoeboaphelidium occidentale]|nr:hypothetical protein MP638_000988 [Amoeboaphelidium occidentale]
MNDQSRSSSFWYVFSLIISSILCSVLLILANKMVMKAGFDYALTLSAMHFASTSIFSRVSAKLGFFEPKRGAIPLPVLFKMALFGTCSIVFMNLNLKSNSIGFYQMTKLLCIPYMVIFQRIYSNSKISVETLLSLALILLGVALVTVSDVKISPGGFVFGVAAVISTAQFQIWQGTKQTEYKLNPMQITDSVMPAQFVVCSILAMLLETNSSFSLSNKSLFDVNDISIQLLQAIMLTCLLAVAVNIVTYALIGKTSAVSYQVVGHLKTVLTLIGGYYLFPADLPEDKVSNTVLGIAIALIGMIIYGDVKTAGKGNSMLSRYTGLSFWTREI